MIPYENPYLYEIAKQITHETGADWYDPRTGKKYPAPKEYKRAKQKRTKARHRSKRRND